MLSDDRVYNFGGDTVHEVWDYPCCKTNSPVVFPYELINKDSKVIIYGAGQIGREYVRQLQKTEYCQLVLWVDKQSMNEHVNTPDLLLSFSKDNFDFIILATRNSAFLQEMQKIVKNAGIPEARVVVPG